MSAPAAGLTLLGVPFDANSSYLRGPAKAPAKIREALFSDSSNLWTEAGVDLGAPSVLRDAGDLRLPEEAEPAFAAIERAVRDQLARDARLLFLGGDHSITFPLVRAIAAKFSPLTILHFDAHPDLYDEFEGNRYSHACPFTRIMEQGLAARLVQVGIRTMNRRQREQAERFGVEVHELKNGAPLADIALRGGVYVSFDLDVLDPAFAPGVSHWEPGGFSVREAISLIQAIPAPLVAADVVEYNPDRDVSGRTAIVAAKIVKELASKLLA